MVISSDDVPYPGAESGARYRASDITLKGDTHSMADTTLHLTEQSFDDEIGKHKEVLMVDFWAEWCQPCRAIAPTLEELASESKGSVSLAKVNVDDNPQLAARYGVRSIPTILFMKGGQVMDQVIGAVPKSQLKKKLDALA
jgi:thioredoxin 1